MGQNNKKYLDYAGLEKLVDMHAVVPHPQATEVTDQRALKIAYDEHGHITGSRALTPADLGLQNALHFIGESSTDPLTTGVTCSTRPNNDFEPGDVCIYKRPNETGYEEYIYTGEKWELLGDADSYALKSVTHTSADNYILIDGTAKGSADHSKNSTIGHKSYSEANPAIIAVGRDSGGHVVLGKGIGVAESGEFSHTHSHTTATSVTANTYVTEVTPTPTHLDIGQQHVAKVLSAIPGTFGNLETTQIAGVNGSTTASKATAGTAKDIAKVGTAVRYGTADVGDTVTGLAKRAASTTNVGNANIASEPTLIGNADVGAATRYGTANVGAATRYGTANVGETTVVATRASAETVVGNANMATTGTQVATAVKNITQPKATVSTTNNNAAFYATVTSETLELTPIAISVALSDVGVELDTTEVYEAVASQTKIYAVGGTASVTSAVAAPSTQTLTPAVAAPEDQILTPAVKTSDTIYGAVASNTQIYGVTAEQVTVTSATEAPETQTVIPAVANGTITPYTFADITVPVAANATVVATGNISANAAGDAVMTGVGTLGYADVLGKDTTLVAGTSGDVQVVASVASTKNTATTFNGTTDDDSFTHDSHTHSLFIQA